MDQEHFLRACRQVMGEERERAGIGTLSEKTVHAVLKRYFEADASCYEKKIDGYYADVCNETEIIEIQTANFDKLRKKLAVFLAQKPVNIVYPIPHRKILRWIDEETGEISKGRKSPKIGTPYEVFRELYKIRSFLSHPNLRLTLMLLDVEEYRFLNGWSKDRKRGSVRAERLPIALEAEYHLDSREDYTLFVPSALPKRFTSKEYQKAVGVSLAVAQKALLLLYEAGTLRRVDKKRNSWVYERSSADIY